jgi:hypothetical protein
MTSSHQIHARTISLERIERECSGGSTSNFWGYVESDYIEAQPSFYEKSITKNGENVSIKIEELPSSSSDDSNTTSTGEDDNVEGELPSPSSSDESIMTIMLEDIAVEEKLPPPSWETASTISSDPTECEHFDEVSFGARCILSKAGRRESLLTTQLSPILEETSEMETLEVEMPVFSYDADEAIVDKRSAVSANSKRLPTNQCRMPLLWKDERRDSGIIIRRPALVDETAFPEQSLVVF